MSEIQITTTQNVNINFKAAEAGQRILAWFIDVCVKGSYILLLVGVFFSLSSFGSYLFDNLRVFDYWSFVAVLIIFSIPVVFYSLALEYLFDGQTIGKKIVQIQVVKIDGFRPDFLDFFTRWVMRIVDLNIMSGVVALVAVGSTKNHQRLGGLASGTAVILKKNKVKISHTILQELDTDYKPTYMSVIKLSDNDMRIVKENYERAKSKNDNKTILKIKDKIILVMKEEPLKMHHASEFIEVVLKDYNYFTKNM